METKTSADVVDLQTLFQDSVSYRIPQFQRPYAWGERQWEPLWDDVRNVAECYFNREEDDRIRPHFMGAIVLQQQKHNTGEVTKRLVVDGQQRLTTLQLLIRATQQAFQNQDDTARVARFRALLTNPTIYWGGDDENETKIRQSNRNDQRAFQDAITNDYNDDHRQPWTINKVHAYYKKKVNTWLNSEPANRTAKADALEEALTKHLQIAVIDLAQDEKPHVVFETLNARGESLKQSDLIKNTVMYEANVIDDALKAKELWGMFNDEWWQKDTRDRLNRNHLDRFLNYWMVMKTLKPVSDERVSAEFRNYIGKENATIEAIADKIKKAGIVYKDIEEVKLSEIKTFLGRMKVIELGVVTPLLLWLYTTQVPQQQRRKSIRVLESYVVRQKLCGYSTAGLNKFFIALLEKLSCADPMQADNTIINYLSDQTGTNREWPNDLQVKARLVSERMTTKIAFKKMVLEAVEMSLRTEKSEPLGRTKELTVEHVLPQRWEQNWPLTGNQSDRTEAELTEERTRLIATIGNLTLTTAQLNTSLSNGPWHEKRQTLGNHSSLFLNKTLLDDAPDIWDETAIQLRSVFIAQRILQIWPSADRFTESDT